MAELPPLTERQRQVFDFIQDRIRAWGYPPTIREIGEKLGIKSTNGVADHLKALKRKGYLVQEEMKSRTLRPANDLAVVPDVPAAARSRAQASSRGARAVRAILPGSGSSVSIPLLGRVAAGEPILAEEQAEGSVVVDSFLVGDGSKVFALKVVGTSMIDDGIFDGDYIFVRKRSHADPGDIVVVMIDNEATVKRYYPEGDRIRLQPANETMKPIIIHKSDLKQTQLIGIVVGVYRKV